MLLDGPCTVHLEADKEQDGKEGSTLSVYRIGYALSGFYVRLYGVYETARQFVK